MTLTFAQRAGRWFLASGIQETGGGVARYYRSDLGRNNPVSTEITGYATGAFVYLHALTAEQVYLDRAALCARFLAKEAWDTALVCMPFEHGEGAAPMTFFFDSGIIARGLLAAWRATGEAEFLAAAGRCGLAMLRDFAAIDGFHPVLTLPDKRPVPRDDRWSRSTGCYQLKAAMVWRELYEATGDTTFEAPYCRMLEEALQSHSTFLPGHPDPLKVVDRLHAYSYFLEGMLPFASDPRCALTTREGIARVAAFLRQAAPRFERSDVYAQLLRARLFADWNGVEPLDAEAARFEAAQLAGFQCSSPDPRIDGGFWFGRRDGAWLPYVNPVSAAFALQALAMWNQHQAGAPQTFRHMLI